jgi:HPt (histidine-containing phosphotransfer) domain-containing protein
VTVLIKAGIDQVLEPTRDLVGEVIDTEHLSRMTLGDRALEREVLALFARQAEMLMARLDVADRPAALAAAHTLKGSAQGIGAHEVAQTATALERAARAGRDIDDEVTALASATARACTAIATLLRTD